MRKFLTLVMGVRTRCSIACGEEIQKVVPCTRGYLNAESVFGFNKERDET